MTSGTDPPFYICFEVFDDNLQKFRDNKSLAQCVYDWLLIQYPHLPFVLSPLHTPENSKSHIHGIAEIHPVSGITFNDFSALFKAYDLPRPELCNNVISFELYLTHDTAQSRKEDKQRFSVADRQSMLYANGYKLHKQTARDKADSVSMVVMYVSDKLHQTLGDNPFLDIDDLYSLVADPDFYSDLISDLPFDLIVSKGKNELKVHYRWYTDIASAKRKKHGSKPCYNQQETFCLSIIQDCCDCGDMRLLRNIHYALWANFDPYRILLSNNGGGHNDFVKNLILAVNYFKSNNKHMQIVYNTFFELIKNNYKI